MGPKTTPSLISKGGIRYPPPWEGGKSKIGLIKYTKYIFCSIRSYIKPTKPFKTLIGLETPKQTKPKKYNLELC